MYVSYKYRNKKKFCSIECVGAHQSGDNNPAFGKVYRTKETHPEWAEKIHEKTKGKVNLGDSNGMKKKDARKKVSETKKRMFAENPEMREHLAAASRKAWADGKFDGVKVGRAKWYKHVKPNGVVIKVQGRWELAFARWLDAKGFEYKSHRDWIDYVDENSDKRTYYPDFYVVEWKSYVDVKNQYHYDLNREKFDQIRASNPGIALRVILKEELDSMGVFDFLKDYTPPKIVSKNQMVLFD